MKKLILLITLLFTSGLFAVQGDKLIQASDGDLTIGGNVFFNVAGHYIL